MSISMTPTWSCRRSATSLSDAVRPETSRVPLPAFHAQGGRRVTGGGPADTNECEPNRCLAVCRRTAVTTVRVVHVLRHNRPARAPDGSDVPDWRLHQRLIVLADTVPGKDGGHRAVPLWLRVFGYKELLSRLGQPAADAEVASGLLETAARVLRGAGAAG